MADFPTKAALLTKTVVETVTIGAQDVVVPMVDYVVTGSGTNSSAQGFEHARAQVVEWFLDMPATVAAGLTQLTVLVQVSDDAAAWYDLDEESMSLTDTVEGMLITDLGDRKLRLAVNVGSRQNAFMRLALVSSAVVPGGDDVIISARVAGISQIFTKSS